MLRLPALHLLTLSLYATDQRISIAYHIKEDMAEYD